MPEVEDCYRHRDLFAPLTIEIPSIDITELQHMTEDNNAHSPTSFETSSTFSDPFHIEPIRTRRHSNHPRMRDERHFHNVRPFFKTEPLPAQPPPELNRRQSSITGNLERPSRSTKTRFTNFSHRSNADENVHSFSPKDEGEREVQADDESVFFNFSKPPPDTDLSEVPNQRSPTEEERRRRRRSSYLESIRSQGTEFRSQYATSRLPTHIPNESLSRGRKSVTALDAKTRADLATNVKRYSAEGQNPSDDPSPKTEAPRIPRIELKRLATHKRGTTARSHRAEGLSDRASVYAVTKPSDDNKNDHVGIPITDTSVTAGEAQERRAAGGGQERRAAGYRRGSTRAPPPSSNQAASRGREPSPKDERRQHEDISMKSSTSDRAQLKRSKTIQFKMGLDMTHWDDKDPVPNTPQPKTASMDPSLANAAKGVANCLKELNYLEQQLQNMSTKVLVLLALLALIWFVGGIMACFTPSWWFALALFGQLILVVLGGYSFRTLLEAALKSQLYVLPVMGLMVVVFIVAVVAERGSEISAVEIVCFVLGIAAVGFYAAYAWYAATAGCLISRRNEVLFLHQLLKHPQALNNYTVLPVAVHEAAAKEGSRSREARQLHQRALPSSRTSRRPRTHETRKPPDFVDRQKVMKK